MTSSRSKNSSKIKPTSPQKTTMKPSEVKYKQTARIRVMDPVLATGGRQLAKPSPRQLAQLKPLSKKMKRTAATLKKKKQLVSSSEEEKSEDDDSNESSDGEGRRGKKDIERDVFGDAFWPEDETDSEEDMEENESEDEGFERDTFGIESDEEERGDQDRHSPQPSESFAGSSNRDYIARDDGDDDDY